MNVSVIWHLLSACELIHIFVCKGKTAIIMLKILCGFVQTVLDKVTKVCVPFVYCFVVIEKRKIVVFVLLLRISVFFIWKETILKCFSVPESCVSVSLLGDKTF